MPNLSSSRPGRPKKKDNGEKKKKGSRRKGNYRSRYSKETFEEALEAVRSKRMSIRAAAKHYGVPRVTMMDRLSERRGSRLGKPTELSAEEEDYMVERLVLMGTWGFPIIKKELTLMVKRYLDRQGRRSRNVSKLKKFEIFLYH